MTRTATAVLALLVAGSATAQEPVRSEALLGEPTERTGMAPPARLFEIRDGRLWLDGRALPESSVPSGLDLSGVVMQLELVGPVTPVVEVDGELFVLERERLVPFETSSKAGSPVYIMGEAAVSPQAATADMLEPVVDEVYLRQLSDADRTLYDKLQEERRLEAEIAQLARRTRSLAPGPEHDAMATELRQRIGTLFDLKQEIRREELDRAESDLRALRAILIEREEMRDDIITHRFHELLGTKPLDR